MPHTHDNAGYDPYRINSIQEIDQILLQILEQGILLRMHGGNPQHAVITTLIDIDFDSETLIIDSAAQQTMNQQLVDREQAFFEAVVDHVSIEFSVSPISHTTYDQRPALSGPIPHSLRRLQRRNSFRIQSSVTNPATCTLMIKDDAITFPIFDISASGLSFLDEKQIVEAHKGKIFANTQLHLPGIGHVAVDLQIVRQQNHYLASGKGIPRFGCAFFALKGPEQIRIQNYINQEERAQIAKDRGLA